MKVIFLDIDGVLATNKEFATNRTKFREKYLWAKELRVPYKFNKGCVEVFNEILEITNAILSLVQIGDFIGIWMSWIKSLNLTELINHQYLVPKNKRKMSSDLEDDRVYQINEWVKFNKPEKWVAIDDMNLSSLGPNFFRTKILKDSNKQD
jgi:hypothetical protein